jgi:hypothetical protein
MLPSVLARITTVTDTTGHSIDRADAKASGRQRYDRPHLAVLFLLERELHTSATDRPVDPSEPACHPL